MKFRYTASWGPGVVTEWTSVPRASGVGENPWCSGCAIRDGRCRRDASGERLHGTLNGLTTVSIVPVGRVRGRIPARPGCFGSRWVFGLVGCVSLVSTAGEADPR